LLLFGKISMERGIFFTITSLITSSPRLHEQIQLDTESWRNHEAALYPIVLQPFTDPSP
jgi:hypothetical protein